MTERRQPRLADGRRSLGYVPVEVETVDSSVSCAALGLLLRLRRDSQRRETDGLQGRRELVAVAAYHDLQPREIGKLLAELEGAGLVQPVEEAHQDVNFRTWCHSREEREALREQDRLRKQRERKPDSSQGESQGMSRRDSGRNPEDKNRSHAPIDIEEEVAIEVAISGEAKLPPPNPPQGGATGSKDPEGTKAPVGVALVVFVHEALGRVLSTIEKETVHSWPTKFAKLSDAEIRRSVVDTEAKYAARRTAIRSVEVFEGPLKQLVAEKVDQPWPSSPRSNSLKRMESIGDLLPARPQA